VLTGIVVIFGAGGIGWALARNCCQRDEVSQVILVGRRQVPNSNHPKLSCLQLDVFDEDGLQAMLAQTKPNVVVSTIGLLHSDGGSPEKRIADFSLDWFIQSQTSNAAAALIIGKAINATTKRVDQILFAALSARVGSISDNSAGGWYSYRSSKAALNMAIKTLSLEWANSRPKHCVLLLHPGTVATNLSSPFSARVKPEKLFSPELAAEYLIGLLANASSADTGKFLAWDGATIEW
jgi:NAD(P)-dependent dehydrogenase (short-subunit alcohol dehydrogenase family)